MGQNNNHDWDPPEPYYLDADDFPPPPEPPPERITHSHGPVESIAITLMLLALFLAPFAYILIILAGGK